jgi:hypothetical protein
MIFATVILIEVPGMLKKNMRRELIAFFVLIALGMALSIPQALGVKIPSPTKPIEALFRPLSKLLK